MTTLVSLTPIAGLVKVRRYDRRDPNGQTIISHEGWYAQGVMTPPNVAGYIHYPRPKDRRGFWSPSEAAIEPTPDAA